MVEVRRATLADAHDLAPRLRADDVAEVEASGGYAPLGALLASLEASEVAFALVIDGRVEALFGVAAPGVVWLLGSDVLLRRPLALCRQARVWLPILLDRYPVLTNCVDARYRTALRLAEWLGFEIGPEEPFGIAGLPFRRIEIRRST